jgi:hypothetical protein
VVYFVGALKSGPFCGGNKEWYFVGALKSGPFFGVLKSGQFCGGTEMWSILCCLHDKNDCQIKKAFVFPHSQNGRCTCAVIAVGSTGI